MSDSTEDKPKQSWWRRLSGGLKRTSTSLGTAVADLVTKRKLDRAMLDDIEDVLLRADLGTAVAERIAEAVGEGRYDKAISADEVKAVVATEVEKVLAPVARPLVIDDTLKPFVILVVGVNGSGKTTTIGKLARRLKKEGLSVMLAAGDTFRAAAVEQLAVWGERNGVPVVSQAAGADPAAVVFDALQSARARSVDVLIADTAGRLHTQSHLMDELAKIARVAKRLDADAPHEVLLVLDAGLGQNAVRQAEQFNRAIGITGIVVTKLDGTAKGGVVIAIARRFGLPIRFVGVGEQAEDFGIFDARAYVEGLLRPVGGSA
jgi:fused signal recognition particle receptor